MRKLFGAACAAALAAVLGGCAPEPDNATPAPAAEPWHDDVRPADSGGRLGTTGTACVLPVSFDLAKSWKAQAVTGDGGTPARQGGYTMACEVDAKPAGNVGFMRVWTGNRAEDAWQVLDAFLAADKNLTHPQVRATTAGQLPGAEATYIRDNPKTESRKRERVLAVTTSHGAVLLVLGGLDSQEHEQMLPAYVLAKRSVTVS